MSNGIKFGVRLKELREEAGLTMRQLADAIGVSDAAVCKWENGAAEPKASYIMKLAEFFDCTTDYLIGNDGEYASGDKIVAAARLSTGKKTKLRIYTADGKSVSGTQKSAAVAAATTASVELSTNEAELISLFRKLTPEMKKLVRSTAAAVSDNTDNGK